MKFEELVNKIASSPQLLSLKKVVENNPYHNNENVYSHSLSTYEIAKQKIQGKFITNQEAKSLWNNFLDKEIGGMKRKDILILVALLHDFGKCLSFEEDGEIESILSVKPTGATQCSNHEFWGSVFIKEFLKRFSLSEKLIEYISSIIRLHDSFNDGYFKPKVDWPIGVIIKDLKARADGFYIEVLFNIYCDNYNAKNEYGFAEKIVKKIFSSPSLYTPRKYLID